MDLLTVIKLTTFIGTGYFLQCAATSAKYCTDQNVVPNDNTKYMARGLAGGVLAMTMFCYKAAWGGSAADLQTVALVCFWTFTFWFVNAVHRIFMTKTKPSLGSKIDVGICTMFMSLYGFHLFF